MKLHHLASATAVLLTAFSSGTAAASVSVQTILYSSSLCYTRLHNVVVHMM